MDANLLHILSIVDGIWKSRNPLIYSVCLTNISAIKRTCFTINYIDRTIANICISCLNEVKKTRQNQERTFYIELFLSEF